MIGTVLGSTMIVAGVLLSGWGQWRLCRPLRFFAKMREAQLREIGAGRWADFLGGIERRRNANGDRGHWESFP